MQITITEDGTHEIGVVNSAMSQVDIEGTFGSGTVTIKSQRPGSSNKLDLGSDMAVTANASRIINHAKGRTLFAIMSGSSSPSVTVEVSPVGVSDL